MNKITYRDVNKLIIYTKSCSLAQHIYETVKDSKEYSLRDQIIRSSSSTMANIAEGYTYCEVYPNKYLNFLLIAYGSLNETKAWIDFFATISLITSEQRNNLLSEANEIGYMFIGLINSVQKEVS